MKIQDRLIVALDGLPLDESLALVHELKDLATTFKVGLGMFSQYGPKIVEEISRMGAHVFLDLKFYDIPMQVGEAVKAACKLGPRFITVHGLGGPRMLEEALAALTPPTNLLVVSLLTSFDDQDIIDLGFKESLTKSFQNLARLSHQAGAKHFVASPLEARFLKDTFGQATTVVCPGIRATGMPCQDQRRTLSAGEAINEGADLLVVGRPITKALDRRKATEQILSEMVLAHTLREKRDVTHAAT